MEIIKIEYYWNKSIELSEKNKQKNRTAAMSGEIEATLNKMIWGQSSPEELKTSIQKGYNFAKNLDKQEMLEIRGDWIQISNPKESLDSIKEIENLNQFNGWVDVNMIYEIKQKIKSK